MISNDDVFRSTGIERVQPGSDRRPIPLDRQYRSSCPVDEDLAQVDVATFANAEQPRLASSGILPWHDSKPRGKVASLSEGCSVAEWRPRWPWRR